MVGLKVRFLSHEIGNSAFLHAFFSTVCVRLENGKWGSRFPCLMRELYYKKLSGKDVQRARAELKTIREELKKFPPDQIVWDIEDLTARPPWGDRISKEITDLSNYFVTSDGKDLIDVFSRALLEATVLFSSVEIQQI